MLCQFSSFCGWLFTQELKGAGFDQKGKPGLLGPAHDDITLSGQIKHCKILEISSEHIRYVNIHAVHVLVYTA